MCWKKDLDEAGKRNLKVYEYKGVEWWTPEVLDELKKTMEEAK